MDKSSTPSCGSCGSRWKLLLLLVPVLVLVALISRNRDMRETTETEVRRPAGQTTLEAGKTVSLTIDSGDGPQKEFEQVAWREGMTVRDALAATRESPDAVKFSQRGEGESAFLTALDGVRNEGAGGRNWTFKVNGEYGDRSFSIYPLEPGDQVLWTFAEQN